MRAKYRIIGLCMGLIAYTIPAFLHLLTGGVADGKFIIAYMMGLLGLYIGHLFRGLAEDCIRDAEKEEK